MLKMVRRAVPPIAEPCAAEVWDIARDVEKASELTTLLGGLQLNQELVGQPHLFADEIDFALDSGGRFGYPVAPERLHAESMYFLKALPNRPAPFPQLLERGSLRLCRRAFVSIVIVRFARRSLQSWFCLRSFRHSTQITTARRSRHGVELRMRAQGSLRTQRSGLKAQGSRNRLHAHRWTRRSFSNW
jgi:hypothetical protein